MIGALKANGEGLSACGKSFWIYKRLNKCAAPAPEKDDVLVVEEEVFFMCGVCQAGSRLPDAKEATTKTSSLSGAGAAQLFNNLKLLSNSNTAYRTHLVPRTFTIRFSADSLTVESGVSSTMVLLVQWLY